MGVLFSYHYGFLSNRSRKQKLEVIKNCLQAPVPSSQEDDGRVTEAPPLLDTLCPCPKCHTGHLQIVYEIPAKPQSRR